MTDHVFWSFAIVFVSRVTAVPIVRRIKGGESRALYSPEETIPSGSPRAVQDPDYLDAFGRLAVKDNVVPNRKLRKEAPSLLRARPIFGKASEGLTLLVDRIEEAVCFGGTVICNVIPDIENQPERAAS